IILAVGLSSSVFAGDIPTDGLPQNESQTIPQIPPGDIPTDGLAADISDGAVSALLSAIDLLTV
ncbi:MAG TPA: hypothetical protein VIF64_15745, partial [Pyrinomonadaceae bacterium]